MTKEEAQALAEQAVLEYARGGHLEKLSLRNGEHLLTQGIRMLQMAMAGLSTEMAAGKLHTGGITALAALCIEVIRETTLKYGPPEEGTRYGDRKN